MEGPRPNHTLVCLTPLVNTSRPAGTIVAQGVVTLACISAEGAKMMAVPEKVLASMNLSGK